MATSAAPRRRVRGADRRREPIAGRATVYVFELPVRIAHWTIVATLIALSFTGYYIYHPFFAVGEISGRPGFTMGEMRFIHLVAGSIFIAAVMLRVYWSCVGNEHARWQAMFPLTKRQRKDLVDTIAFYFYRRRAPAKVNGHNPLAALAYFALYCLFLVTILTGLGLFAWIVRVPPWTTLFSWTWTVLPVPEMRLVHFLLMFCYLGFAIHHVYSAVLYDMEERNGELSSIFSGWKSDVLGEVADEAGEEDV